MTRRFPVILAVFAVAVAVYASPAQAAPAFSVSAERQQTAINHGDEYLSYLLKVKNTGDEPSVGATVLTVAFPAGLKLFISGSSGSNGLGWSCDSAASSCTSSAAVAPGDEFPTLKLVGWIYPEIAPQTVNVGFTVSGGGSVAPAGAGDSFVQAPALPFGLSSFTAKAEDEAGADYTLAGGHPLQATSTFVLNTYKDPIGISRPVEDVRDIAFELPAGLVGNLRAASVCTIPEVRDYTCPVSAAVGGIAAKLEIASPGEAPALRPIYRVVPEDGFVAAFAFTPAPPSLSNLAIVLRAKLRSNGDYGVTAMAPLAPQSPKISAVDFATLCTYGVVRTADNGFPFSHCKKPTDTGAFKTPFLTLQTKCAGPAPTTWNRVGSWDHPGSLDAEGFPNLADPSWKSYKVESPLATDCAQLTEKWTGEDEPSFGFQPDTAAAATPAGYSASLRVPQDGLVDPDGRGTAHLKDTTVELPAGLALNPAAADGLGACSEAQVGLVSKSPLRFNSTSSGCPANSKIGSLEVDTPLLEKVLHGSVYLAAQDANPFGSKFAIYLVIEDSETGIRATLAGRVDPDKANGRILTTFTDNPQVPFEELRVDFFGGPRSSLVNPDVCGDYTVATALTPWSAVDPGAPTALEIATPGDRISIAGGPQGRPCATSKEARPFGPSFTAGTTTPVAGASSPFTLRLKRQDGDQEFSGIDVTTPPGFAAALKGVGTCAQSALEAAGASGHTGAQELASPSCPASSQVGTTTIGAGAGSQPYYVKTGKVYLGGPYKGAPLSLAFIVPAVAGPFDLGVQVVRTALHINSRTAQVTAKSDPIPQILEGVPLQVRDILVEIDRPNFALNPTNCEAMSVTGRVTGASGGVADLSNRFQVGGCDRLGFKPKLTIRLQGGTKRTDYQRLRATVTTRQGDANIARAAVTLPHSAFLAQEHIRTVCTRVQFAAHACPPGSIYGHATAVTPLLDGRLQGPVYLRSSSNKLPDLVAALRGPDAQPIEVELAGRTDSKNGGIRNTFDLVPDAPVTEFTLQLLGGRKSLIINSRDLCKQKQRATVRMQAQNGRVRNFRPVIKNDCKKAKNRGKGSKKQRRVHTQGWGRSPLRG